MKKISQLFFLFILTVLYGQQVSNYKYITIQESKEFKNNKYGVVELLSSKLKQKNYTILAADNLLSANVDRCDILTVDLVDASNIFKNRITINFKDCNNKTISTTKGISSIKEYEPGFQDALMRAVTTIAISNPIERVEKVVVENVAPVTIQVETQNENAVVKTEKKMENSSVKTQSSSSQTYNNGKITTNRIFLANNQFILVNPNNSVPYATFKPSTKANVFHVTLGDGTVTIGYTENNEIVIDIANVDGSFIKETFTSK